MAAIKRNARAAVYDAAEKRIQKFMGSLGEQRGAAAEAYDDVCQKFSATNATECQRRVIEAGKHVALMILGNVESPLEAAILIDELQATVRKSLPQIVARKAGL